MPTLSFRYVSRSATAAERDLLLLEQEAWSGYTGLLTKANFLRYLRAVLYDEEGRARIDCGYDGDRLEITIYAWPLAAGVTFRLLASVGDLGEMTVDTVPAAESLSFQLDASATLRHPAMRVESVRWLTGPYDAEGRLVLPPTATVSGRELTLSAPVYGSAWVRTSGTRYTCKLIIPRDTAEALLAAGWSEYVVGLPTGGRPVALELEPPPGAAALAESETPCGRISYRFRDSDQGGPPTAPHADKTVKCDYCKLECEDDA